MSSRGWVFTINNPIPSDYTNLFKLKDKETCFTLCYNLEVGENGTPHIQGNLEMEEKKSRNVMSKLLPRAHLEQRRGTVHQACLYSLKELLVNVNKENGKYDYTNSTLCPLYDESTQDDMKTLNFWIKFNKTNLEKVTENFITTLKKKLHSCTGKMEDRIVALKKLVDQGYSQLDIANADFYAWTRCNRQLMQYRQLSEVPRSLATAPEVIIIIGPTESGKSHWAFEKYPNGFPKQRSKWWCGYNRHKEVILDEFYAYLTYDTLLKMCDKYALMVETKNGNVNMYADTFVFTANHDPKSWYPNCYWPAFARRVTQWWYFKSREEHLSYSSYEDLMKDFNSNTTEPAFVPGFNRPVQPNIVRGQP